MSSSTSCFKIIKSYCPNGVEQMTRNALACIDELGGSVLELSYQVTPINEHCVGIVFEADDLEKASEIYAGLDAIPEPDAAGTTIRRNT